MNKNLYYGMAALSAVGLIGIGSVSATNITERKNTQPEHLQKMSEVIGFDLESVNSKLDSGEKLKDIFKGLGLDKEAIHEKMKTAHTEELNQKVTSGELTQEQADLRLQKSEEFRTKMGDHKMGKRMNRGQFQLNLEKMAEVLGLNIDEVKGEIESGKTMKEVLEARGIDKEFVHQEMQAFHKNLVNQKLEAGEITQEQADDRLEKISERKPGEGPRHGRPERGERSEKRGGLEG